MPTGGLLNTVGAPHLGWESTYKAMYTHTRISTAMTTDDSSDTVQEILGDLDALGYPAKVRSTLRSDRWVGARQALTAPPASCFTTPNNRRHRSSRHPLLDARLKDILLPCCPQVAGYWSSGHPFLDARLKDTRRPWDAGLQLPLMVLDVSALKARPCCLLRYDAAVAWSQMPAADPRHGPRGATKAPS